MKKKPDKAEVGLLATELVAKLRKAYGDAVLRKASTTPATQRVKTGIFPLDLGLGGGYATGRVHTIYGPKSSGKTTIYLKVVARLQRTCVTCFKERGAEGECSNFTPHVCLWLDVEGTFDSEWAEKQGVNTDTLILCSPDYAEQAIDVADALLRSGEVHAIVVDSLAMMTPTKEIEESSSKQLMGNQPKLIGTLMRKITSALNTAENEGRPRPTVFLTNQIRYKLGLLFGNPETQPGGNSPGFTASTETRVQQAGTKEDEDTHFPTQTLVKFKIEKNKTFGPKISGEYSMAHKVDGYEEGDFIFEDSIIEWAERTGYAQGSGNKKVINGRTFNKKAEIETALQARDAWYHKVYGDVLALALEYYGKRPTQETDAEMDGSESPENE